MGEPSSIYRPILMISLLALPAVSIKIMSYYSGNPYLQPLNLTVEGMASVGEDGQATGMVPVMVRVDWGRDLQSQVTQEALRRVIAKSLSSHTDLFRFDFRDVPGARVGVIFEVGPNSFGPYPPSAMSDGIKLALAALQLTNGPRK